MARRELGPSALRVSAAVAAALPGRDVVVGCSGGADSLALAMAAHRAARRAGVSSEAVVVDHGLQQGSDDVAAAVCAQLAERGVSARVERVEVTATGEGLEAAARDARLAVLAGSGSPVLLGHTLDDQAETVLLGLLRGSGTRSLAGMAEVRGPFLRPLLGLRRADTEAACREWGLDWWRDPMNEDPAYARVRARGALRQLSQALGRDLAPALARTAAMARADADLLDALAAEAAPLTLRLEVQAVSGLPDALRGRVLLRWLRWRGVEADQVAVAAADRLLLNWRGQGPLHLPGGTLARVDGALEVTPADRGGAARPPAR